MGNCLHGQRVATWLDDEDWDVAEPDPSPVRKRRRTREVEMVKEKERGNGSTIVKIRITKKQLKELLATADSGKLCKQYVLENLMSIGSVRVEEEKRQWRPELARIAEISEEEQIVV